MKVGILSLCMDHEPAELPALMDVISCHCSAEGKPAVQKLQLQEEWPLLTLYRLCQSRDDCCNPHKRLDGMDEELDQAHGEQQDARTLRVPMSGTDTLTRNN